MEQTSSTLLVVAGLFGLGALSAQPMVKLNVWIYHRLGMHPVAAFCESKLCWWIPAVRTACAIAAIVSLAFGMNLLK